VCDSSCEKDSGRRMSDVSVVVLTRNRCSDLKRCLDSIFAQTYKGAQIVVIDNGSSDGTLDLLGQYQVKVIEDRTHKLSFLFNLAWRSASGDYIAFIADDAEADPAWLETGVSVLESAQDVAAVGGPTISTRKQTMHSLYERSRESVFLRVFGRIYERIVMEDSLFALGRLAESGAYSMGAGLPLALSLDAPIEVDLLTTTNMIVRREVIETLGGFDENFLFNHADGDLFVRMKRTGYRIVFHPRVKVSHFVRPSASREVYYIARDTGYFIAKDVRPRMASGWLRVLLNVSYLNSYWIYRAFQSRDPKSLVGLWAFFKGMTDWLKTPK